MTERPWIVGPEAAKIMNSDTFIDVDEDDDIPF